MSHTKKIATRIRDPVALAAACRRLGIPEPYHGTIPLNTGPATGWVVQFENRHGPVVIDVETGQLAFDNTEGECGEFRELSKLLRAYACQKAGIEARCRGHTLGERTLSDGSIVISVERGGGS